MYRCTRCGKLSEPREPQHKVVLEKRPREYTQKIVRGYGKSARTIVRKSTGWEIAKEGAICPRCAAKEAAIEETKEA